MGNAKTEKKKRQLANRRETQPRITNPITGIQRTFKTAMLREESLQRGHDSMRSILAVQCPGHVHGAPGRGCWDSPLVAACGQRVRLATS